MDTRDDKALPPTLFDFAFFHDYDAALRDLAVRAQKEVWLDADVPGRQPHPLGALRSYLDHTYRRLVDEDRILTNGIDERGRPCALFNTALQTSNQRFIYARFRPAPNPSPAHATWVFVGWVLEDESIVQTQIRDGRKSLKLRPASFFDQSPGELFFRPGASVQFNEEHFLQDHPERFPESFASLERVAQFRVLNSSFHFTERLVQMNWRIAVPFLHRDRQRGQSHIQLLVPFYLTAFYEDEDAQPNLATAPDCVLVLDPRFNGSEFIGYFVPTKLTCAMARKNARLLGRFTQPWLA